MYKVLIAFTDAEDGHVYNVGDVYPRAGAEPSDERIAFLLGDKNNFDQPVIDGKPTKKRRKEGEA